MNFVDCLRKKRIFENVSFLKMRGFLKMGDFLKTGDFLKMGDFEKLWKVNDKKNYIVTRSARLSLRLKIRDMIGSRDPPKNS